MQESGIEWLNSLRDYESNRTGDIPNLDAISAVLDAIADPQLSYRVIHIAGTNGKGSVAHVCSAVALALGMRVGTYTSPDLGQLTERVTINMAPVSAGYLSEELATLRDIGSAFRMPKLSRFEALTAAAFSVFALEGIELGVIEAGMGGQWDATNVVQGEVVVIPSVSLDHTRELGATTEEIAEVKAGVITPNSRVILGSMTQSASRIFQNRSDEAVLALGSEIVVEELSMGIGGWRFDLRTPMGRYKDLFLQGHGRHHVENAALAVAAMELIHGAQMPQVIVEEALLKGSPPGRIEVVSRLPLVVVDVAHNPAAAAAISRTLREEFAAQRGWVVVTSLAQGRDPGGFLKALGPAAIDSLYSIEAKAPQLDAVEVAHAASLLGIRSHTSSSLEETLAKVTPSLRSDQGILVTGSHHIVGEARRILRR